MRQTAPVVPLLDPGHSGPAPPRGPAIPRRLRASLGTALAAAGFACGGEPPVGPTQQQDQTCPSASAPLCSPSNAAVVSAAREGAGDAAGRATPALENTTARTALGTALSQLDAALATGNVTKGRDALRAAREALTTARGQLATFAGDAADLAAIELMLDQIAPLLGVS